MSAYDYEASEANDRPMKIGRTAQAWRLARATVASALLLGATATMVLPALALLPQAPSLPLPAPSAGANEAAHAYQVKRVGSIDVAPLTFQGVRLFDVTAPAAQDPKAFPPVAARIDIIQDNLREVLPQPTSFADVFQPAQTRYDADTFLIKVQSSNGYSTLVATDEKGSVTTTLLTVTELDAKYNNVTQELLARSWADILQSVLGEALRQRAPGAFEKQASAAGLGLLIAIALTLLIILVRSGLARWRQVVDGQRAGEAEVHASDRAPIPKTSFWHRALLATIETLTWLLAWSILLLWAAAVLWVLFQFAPTQALARTLAGRLGAVLIIWFAASVVSRIGSFAISRFANMYRSRPFSSKTEAARRLMRTTTLKSSLEYAKTTLIYIVAGAITLSALGASTSAVVTLGAAVAFAISFGAQSLVKDFVNGFFILAEDQYAIGDFVTIGTEKGIVAEVTLRITQLRSADGRLVTIPNSQVAVVENWTRDYSRVDYRIAVAFDSDVDRALKVFDQVLHAVANQPEWGWRITEPPTVLGVESISSLGAVLLGQIQTSPGLMFELTRELNRRMLEAFAREGIPLGTPVTRNMQAAAQAPRASDASGPAES